MQKSERSQLEKLILDTLWKGFKADVTTFDSWSIMAKTVTQIKLLFNLTGIKRSVVYEKKANTLEK